MSIRRASFGSTDQPERTTFEQLVRAYRPALHAHVRVVYPDVDTDAVVNDTFVIAWQRRATAITQSQQAWLRGIARNVVFNTRRGQRRWVALNDRLTQLDPPHAVEAPDADSRLQLSVVMDALATLSQTDRELLLMIAVDDLSTEEMASIIDVTPGAAKARVSRARQRLRDAVQHLDLAPKNESVSDAIAEVS